ncbi:hypothetical protein FH972_006121 [Carpinus fangiana]|uniref:Uncharacterized protein n=1 Tax=Carpinus fangiana TaxID=176857 RepID=A0A5N6QT51_9ROSI|nr:hypothetical protein FH972_006121 [Carpinus fangiana]
MEEVDVVMEEVDDLMEEVDEEFDVEYIPDSTKGYGGITPLIGGYLLSWIEEYAQLAIDAYHNHLRKKNLV